jgi:hypothetical protein
VTEDDWRPIERITAYETAFLVAGYDRLAVGPFETVDYHRADVRSVPGADARVARQVRTPGESGDRAAGDRGEKTTAMHTVSRSSTVSIRRVSPPGAHSTNQGSVLSVPTGERGGSVRVASSHGARWG